MHSFNRFILFVDVGLFLFVFGSTLVKPEHDESPWEDDGVIPECNGFHPSTNPRDVALLLVTDHTIQQDKVSRVQYLYRAIACELPPEIQVKIVDVDRSESKVSEWMNAREIRRALQRNDSDGKAAPLSHCDRLSSIPSSALESRRSNSTRDSIPIHVFIVVDEDDLDSDCDFHKAFQDLAKLASVSDPSKIHLDVIGIGKKVDFPSVRVRVPRWQDIDTSSLKIGYAGQQDGVKSVFRFGAIMQQYAQLIHLILTEDLQNDVMTAENPRDLQSRNTSLKVLAPVVISAEEKQFFKRQKNRPDHPLSSLDQNVTDASVATDQPVESKTTKKPEENQRTTEPVTVMTTNSSEPFHHITEGNGLKNLPIDEWHNWVKDDGWKYILGLGILWLLVCLVLIVCCMFWCFLFRRRNRDNEDSQKLLNAEERSTDSSTPKGSSLSQNEDPYSPVTYGLSGANDVPEIQATAPISMTQLETMNNNFQQRPRLAKPTQKHNESIPRVEREERLIF